MRTSHFFRLLCHLFLGCSVFCYLGCGGSNLNNPVTDTADAEGTEEASELSVSVSVTKETVKPGEEVEITASVEGVRGTSVVINWLNITGYGTLSATNETRVTWTAPDSLGDANTRVEVLQLVVTVISEIVSVGASGIKTDTQILSDTKEILLQVVRE